VPEESEKAASPDDPKAARSFSVRAERSLKDADRLFKKNPDRPAQQQAMTQVEQAKVWALLNLAQSIRENRGS